MVLSWPEINKGSPNPVTFQFFPLRPSSQPALLRSLAIASGALILAGCTSSSHLQALREAPGFSAGYGDGCTTATEADKSFSTEQSRDEYAFDNDEAYRAGWRQGYLECSTQTSVSSDGGRILGEANEY